MIYAFAFLCGFTIALVGVLAVLAVGHVTRAWEQERAEWARERADLLQRITAPDYAAVQHYNDNQEVVAPPAVNPDVDEDYWLGKMSKDELADVMAQEEVTGG